MSPRSRIVLILLCVSTPTSFLYAKEKPRKEPAGPAAIEEDIAVYFSPKGGCTEAIVKELQAAKKSIDMQAYSFTSTDIAKALGEAHERGVHMRAITDKRGTGSQYSGAAYLRNHGVATYTDGEHPIAHNKVILIDGETIITGSFNFTKPAETGNAENLLVINGKPKLSAAFNMNFEHHLEHAKKYEGVKDKNDETRSLD